MLERCDVVVNSKIADLAYNATAETADTDETVVQNAAIIESTQSGTIVCGSSREFAGFDCQPDNETLRRVLIDCIGVVSALGRLRVIRGYAGLRPFSPDGMPIIGAVSSHERINVASGHERAGHGLAPVTGRSLPESSMALPIRSTASSVRKGLRNELPASRQGAGNAQHHRRW